MIAYNYTSLPPEKGKKSLDRRLPKPESWPEYCNLKWSPQKRRKQGKWRENGEIPSPFPAFLARNKFSLLRLHSLKFSLPRLRSLFSTLKEASAEEREPQMGCAGLIRPGTIWYDVTWSVIVFLHKLREPPLWRQCVENAVWIQIFCAETRELYFSVPKV